VSANGVHRIVSEERVRSLVGRPALVVAEAYQVAGAWSILVKLA
jgi:hypothetical protein